MNKFLFLDSTKSVGRLMAGIALALLVFWNSATVFSQTVLYDVTFSSPGHTVGMAPTLDFGPIPRFGATALNLPNGTPDTPAEIVVSNFLSMNQPVELSPFDSVVGDMFSGGPQMLFEMDGLPVFNLYHASFDIALDAFSPGMSIFIDAPIHRLDFNELGELAVDSTFIDTTAVGSYLPNQIYHVEIIYNDRDKIWAVIVDGDQQYTGQAGVFSASTLQLRFAKTTLETEITGRSFVDNIVVVGVLFGDINGDGEVDLLDVSPFVNSILTGEFSPEADLNLDGEVNLLDVSLFIDVLSG